MSFVQHCVRLLVLLCLATAVSAAGCSADSRTESEELGSAVIAITQAPDDVRCVQITVEGTRTVTRAFDVQPGSSTVFDLNGLPIGMATFLGEAFGFTCDSIANLMPTWISDPETAEISSGVVANVTLDMRRNGRANVNVDFEDDCIANGAACPTGTGCCSGVCGQTGQCVACLAEGQGCGATSQCCSGLNCVGGVCTSGPTCVPDGSACQQSLPCCSGSCSVTGVCFTCRPVGTACTSSSQCCSGSSCTNGVCTANPTCVPDGSACQQSLPCCSGSCSATGVCFTCRPVGDACTSSSQCCSGSSCTNGVCTANPTCTPSGSACQQSLPCCSGQCSPTGLCL